MIVTEDGAKAAGCLVVLAAFLAMLVLFSSLAFAVFQFRNPKANPTTYITYFTSVHTFQRVPTFQD
jgi:hypothetical protein